MDIQDLDVFIEGVTQVGELIEVDLLLRNGQRLTLTEELRKFKIRNGLFTIEIRGRFNYVKISKFRVDIIKFSIRGVKHEKRTVKNTGSGDGEKGVGTLDPEVVRDKQDPERKRNPYNV